MFLGMTHQNPILAFRQAQEWTRKQFIDELEARSGIRISKQMLGHVETGTRYFGGKVSAAIEQAFGIKVTDQRAVELRSEGQPASNAA
jgi:transcriptional regulator with XRE-family HTH domain